MSYGGAREGAGRKKGSKASHTIQAAEFRKYLISQVIAEAKPIVRALIKQAKKGNIYALNSVMDRVLGKTFDQIAPVGDITINLISTEVEEAGARIKAKQNGNNGVKTNV